MGKPKNPEQRASEERLDRAVLFVDSGVTQPRSEVYVEFRGLTVAPTHLHMVGDLALSLLGTRIVRMS